MGPKSNEIRNEIDALREDLSDKIEDLRTHAETVVGSAKQALHSATDAVGAHLERLDETTVVEWVRKRPLLALGCGVAAGVLIGRGIRARGAKTRFAESVDPELETAEQPSETSRPRPSAPASPWRDEFSGLKEIFIRTAMQSAAIWAADRIHAGAPQSPVVASAPSDSAKH